ncbi:Uncharacterized protein YrrD, contains PRC-barrel domain [Seinonella peptonophila]|uniref:Uncharacterized protein YrrD, contains PRC-barrel domain n=1 Tax=Seinonella peptonophila TaxID=112248 RepID=A0A1M4WA24_9BACL|nr:PRC-barrel domain-containing protein [Seinonella peptonophila]SHE78121.1 Uncharacterized protein YrrD, contains PRC-barrel domain [Seinonella peptonophila]
MRNSQEVVGLTVIDAETGTELGLVSDLLFDKQAHLQGILLEENSWLRRKRYVAKEDFTIGADAVIVVSQKQVQNVPDEHLDWTSVRTGMYSFQDRLLISENGSELGRVKNVYFQEEMGTIVGYELSEGLISDLTTGRTLYRTSSPLRWGKEVLVAPNDSVQS